MFYQKMEGDYMGITSLKFAYDILHFFIFKLHVNLKNERRILCDLLFLSAL
jgi:hypothetical protein